MGFLGQIFGTPYTEGAQVLEITLAQNEIEASLDNMFEKAISFTIRVRAACASLSKPPLAALGGGI